MKILIATGLLNKNSRAPDKLIAEIAPLLAGENNLCVVAGICFDAPAGTVVEGNVRYIRLHSSVFFDKALCEFEEFHKRLGGVDRDKSRSLFIKCHPLYSIGISAKYFFKNACKLTVKSYIKQLNDIIMSEKPDAVIATYMPTEFAYEVLKIKTKCPKFAYQMDPWGLYEAGDLIASEDVRIKQELEMFARSERVFTTQPLYDQYINHDLYREFKDKFVVVEFPNVTKTAVDPEESAISFDKNYINILFCGVIGDGYRSPERFFKKIEKRFLASDLPVRFYFLGTSMSHSIEKFKEKYPDKVILHDRVSPKVARATLRQADFLLNIGNTMSNQVPSKIFDYFSSGRPIINIQKIHNCPAQRYFDKYPLSYNIVDFEDIDYSEELLSFIYHNKGKCVGFETVESIYRTSTPEYVANIILGFLKQQKT